LQPGSQLNAALLHYRPHLRRLLKAVEEEGIAVAPLRPRPASAIQRQPFQRSNVPLAIPQ
jgi:hypothetical protein